MKKILKLFVFFLIGVFNLNYVFCSNQTEINIYKNSILDYEEEMKEYEDYILKYGIIKDIKYFEKSFEKYKLLEKRESDYKKALELLFSCKEANELCNFFDLSSNLSQNKLKELINESYEKHRNYRKKVKKLEENLEYLHKGQRELELKEKFEKTNKFEAEKSIYVLDNEKKEIKKIEKEKNIEKQKKVKKLKKNTAKQEEKLLEEKLDFLLKDYDFSKKMFIYANILKKIENTQENNKLKLLKKIILKRIFK